MIGFLHQYEAADHGRRARLRVTPSLARRASMVLIAEETFRIASQWACGLPAS